VTEICIICDVKIEYENNVCTIQFYRNGKGLEHWLVLCNSCYESVYQNFSNLKRINEIKNLKNQLTEEEQNIYKEIKIQIKNGDNNESYLPLTSFGLHD